MESRLPGLAEWARVRDYRLQQIQRLLNVEVYRQSTLSADDVLAVGADHVVIATGAIWRRDGFGRSHPAGIAYIGPAAQIFTPDDVMAGRHPEGRVVVFDDDFYYMAAVISERIRAEGVPVVLVTSNDMVAAWGTNTAEQTRSQRRVLELGVEIVTAQVLSAFDGQTVVLRCAYTGREQRIEADSLVMVTARRPNDDLYRELSEQLTSGAAGALKSVRRIGDCEAPAIIAAAVHAGHRYARELDTPESSCARVAHDRVFDETP
jgi:dimethylamine/trimethylamine dehydrogenase